MTKVERSAVLGKHRTGWLRWIVAIVAMSLVASACGSDAGSSGTGAGQGGDVTDTTESAVPEEDRYGGTLNIGLSSALGVDAAVVNQVWRNVARALSDSLVFFNPDTSEIEPWLAESWEIEDDRIYRFTLREDVTFNDGTQLTAEVVQANFESLDRPGIHSSARTIVEGIEDIRIPSEFVIEVEFSEPNAAFLTSLSRAHAGIVSEATALLPVEERQNWIDGSGPFYLEEFVPNQHITIKRREGYDWAPAYFGRSGPAYLDEVVYKIIPEDAVRVGAAAGQEELQFIYWVNATYVGQLESAGLVVTFDTLNPATGTELPVNTSSPILSDVRVRQALQISLDRDEYVSIVSDGYDQAATGPLSKANPYYVDVSEHLRYDTERAVELLEEAGWTEVGSDGIRLKDGERLSIRGPQDTTGWQVLQEQWKRIGVELRLEPPLPAEANQQLLSGDYDIAYWYHSTPDPDVLRANYGVETGSNRSFIAPDDEIGQELDRLLQQQNRVLDREARQELVDDAARILIEQAYVIPVINDVDIWAYSPRLQGITANGLDQFLYNAWLSD